MKKKLLTLMTLLVAVCSGAWADDTYEYTNTPALNTKDYFSVQMSDGSDFQTYGVNITFDLADGTSTTVTKAVKMQAKTTITFTTTRTSTVYVGLYARNAKSSDNNNNTFKFDGVAKEATNSTTAGSYEIVTISDVAVGAHTIAQNGKEVEVYYVKVIEQGANTAPSFKATINGSKLTMKSAPAPFTPTAEATFTLTGENLTAGEYDFTVPSVSGTLSVSPSTITVAADGTVDSETTYTVSYTGPGTDVAATDASITATINGVTATIPVNYRAMATLAEQTTISSSKTWDWADVSGPDRASASGATALINYDEYTFGENFDASALLIKSSPNMLSGGAFRLGSIAFTTSVAGTVKVTFSNTSSSNNNRYVTVTNGGSTTTGTVEAVGVTQLTETFDVVAGDVVLGSNNSYIQLYKIEFTAAGAPVIATQGGDVTFNYATDGGTGTNYKDWTQSPINITTPATKVDSKGYISVADKGVVTVTGTDALITKVVITYSESGDNRTGGGSSLTTSPTGYTIDGTTGTWTTADNAGAASVTFTMANGARITKIDVEYASKFTTLNTSGYGTFSYGGDVQVFGVKAYQAALDTDAKTITCTATADNKVPAGAGVLMFSETASAPVYLRSITGAAALSGNDLKGTTDDEGTLATVVTGKFYYTLSGDTFKHFSGTEFKANKAFFESDTDLGASGASSLTIEFNDGNTTGVSEKVIVKGGEPATAPIYNLAGQRVAQPTKGLYIVNGKKVVIK